MKKLITILSLILIANIAMSQDEYVEWAKEMSKLSMEKAGIPGHGNDYHGLIVKQANKEWQGDYVMIAHVIKSQCKAFYELVKMEKPAGMTEKTFENIKAGAMVDWTKTDSNAVLIEADWTMVLHVTKSQLKAYSEIF
jgi:hypothetical protein